MIERFLVGLTAKMEDPNDAVCGVVLLPIDLDPFERTYRFGCHLDAELRMAGAGCSVGGGTLWLDALDEDGEEPEDHNGPVYTVLDVDAADLEATRAILRLNLPELGAPAGTLIQFGEREDRFDGERWHLGEPRSVDEI